MTINSWSNTSILFKIPSGATSGYLVVSVAPTMDNSNPVAFEVTSQPLPNPWVDEDLGNVGVAGTATYASGVFTVNASGTSIGSTSDGMHFVYQPLSGDGSIVARVVSASTQITQAGVMIRETLNPGATDTSVFYKGYVYFYERASTGGTRQRGQHGQSDAALLGQVGSERWHVQRIYRSGWFDLDSGRIDSNAHNGDEYVRWPGGEQRQQLCPRDGNVR